MVRQAAFAGSGKLLKGALHTHTTRSDGDYTPEELLKLYEELGYDFVAITDHRKYNRESFGSSLTIIPGMEVDACFEGTRKKGRHVFHTVCLGPAGGGDFVQDEEFPSFDIQRPEDFQPFLDRLHARGCMTMYCHPEWSHTPASEIAPLKGNFAMELFNSSCKVDNELDIDNGWQWDLLLTEGHRLFGTAVDDIHDHSHLNLGYVVVNARPDVRSILDALAQGAFYASCGPEILDFTVENGRASIQCSPAEYIGFTVDRRPTKLFRAGSDPISRAEFEIPEYASFVRAYIYSGGARAWTNPIFLK